MENKEKSDDYETALALASTVLLYNAKFLHEKAGRVLPE
jgi:hypothetical protein